MTNLTDPQRQAAAASVRRVLDRHADSLSPESFAYLDGVADGLDGDLPTVAALLDEQADADR